MAGSRLNPTLFDKLVADLEIDGLRENDTAQRHDRGSGTVMRFYTVPRIDRFNEAALRTTVRRELSWLLNTTNLDAVEDLTAYPQVKTSVLNYGVPDLAGKTLTKRVIQARAREIRDAIRIFEPRMDPKRLDVEPIAAVEKENAVTYLIRGDITAAVRAMPVEFKTDVEVELGFGHRAGVGEVDPRLLRAYNDELIYLRETAREFGEEYETVAGRLGLATPTDVDPYVERLLEGVAFLAARVNLKLQDQFPEFTQHLLHAIQPHYLAPTPSMCVVRIEPQFTDQVLVTGHTVPRGTELTAIAKDQGGAVVTFRTGQATTLWPLQIIEAEYLATRAAVGPYAAATGVRAESGLRLRFAGAGGVPISKIAPEALPIYLDGSEVIPGELYRQIAGETLAVVARSTTSGDATGGWTHLPTPEQHGFEDDCALLPAEQRSFRGYRLLSEYFTCPERFHFVRLRELGRAFAACTEACDVVLLFSRNAPALAKAVTTQNFRLFATPAINLFEKQLGRIQVRPFEHEFQVLPDRTRPLDFEVYRIIDVVAYGAQNNEPRPVAPLYAFGALLYDWREAMFYVTRLRRRRLSTKEQRLRRRTDYLGTETWMSLTAPGDPAAIERSTELAVRALVTNRELPELLRFGGATDFSISGGPVRSVVIVRAPTRPQPPLGLADGAWRVIGHLTPNYATLAPTDHDNPALLRDHLALYGRIDDAAGRRQIDGVLSVRSEHVTRRVPGQDRLAFARGQRIRIKLDDASYDNARMFLFSAVLERFLAEFATINSFTECVFESVQEGVFIQWPPRLGQRRNI